MEREAGPNWRIIKAGMQANATSKAGRTPGIRRTNTIEEIQRYLEEKVEGNGIRPRSYKTAENVTHGWEKIAILVLLDPSRRFDVVCHKKRLEKYELDGIDTHWINYYLSDHKQQVKTSSWTTAETETASVSSRVNRIGGFTLSDPLSNTYGVI